MPTRTTCARVARDTYFDTLIANGDDLAVIKNADGEHARSARSGTEG
jgi:hypothetical protein